MGDYLLECGDSQNPTKNMLNRRSGSTRFFKQTGPDLGDSPILSYIAATGEILATSNTATNKLVQAKQARPESNRLWFIRESPAFAN